MFKTSASRLSAALLGYVTLVILLLTLYPFFLSVPEQFHISLYATQKDRLANILLFLPIGFLFRLTGGKRLDALLTGAAISLGLEAIQVFVPARTTSVMDLLFNTLGTGIGVALHDGITARVTIPMKMVGQLRLETPLMGLIYLLIPLLWTNRLALNASPARWPLTLLLGLCGAIVFGELARQWFKKWPQKALSAALMTGIWFLFASSPGLLRPYRILPIGLGLVVCAAVLAVLPRRSKDRRYERETLKRLLPFFALYLVVSALWPPIRTWGAWHGIFGFTTLVTDTSLKGLYPRVEYVTAFAMLGYLLAEWRGRDERPLKRDLPRLFALTAGSAIALEVLSGFQTGPGASFVRGALVVPSALLGGIIYHLLRAHVRFLLGRSREPALQEQPGIHPQSVLPN